MDIIEQTAFVSVGRACGFAGLAIVCIMLGLIHEPLLAAETAAVLTFAMTLVLGYRAKRAPDRPYRDTETWLMLDGDDRPAVATAQAIIGAALRAAYLWFARQAALATIFLLMVVIGLRMVLALA